MKWYLNYKHSQELLIHLLAWVFLFCFATDADRTGQRTSRPRGNVSYDGASSGHGYGVLPQLYMARTPNCCSIKEIKPTSSPMWRSASVCCSSPICGLSWSMPIFTVLPLLPKTVWDSGASCCFVCAISFCSD